MWLYIGPVMDWRPDQGVQSLSSNCSWDRLQPPCDPKMNKVDVEKKKMDGWMDDSLS